MPPLVVPRASFVLVEPKVRRTLAQFGLEPDASSTPPAELTARITAAALPDTASAALGALRNAMGEGWARLATEARAIDPTLDGPLRALLLNSLEQVAAAERRIDAHYRMRNETALRRLERAVAQLAPGGVPQERTLNVLSFLAKHGPGVLRAVHDAIEIPLGVTAGGWQGPDCEE